MTRLTTDLIEEVSYCLEERDRDLMTKLGLTLKGLAVKAIFPTRDDLDISHVRAAAVPVTSGKGIIPTFSCSVCAIAQHLGMDCFVTENGDIAGLTEAIQAGVDIVFMADDKEFIALNLRSGKYADNTRSTAFGYCSVLEAALGGLSGKEVLVIGAGRVGSVAIKRLQSRGAKVSLIEADDKQAMRAVKETNVNWIDDMRTGVGQAQAVLNASPAQVPGEWISEGAVISSPGVPYGYDAEGERRARMIVHDPLQIGVAVMAVWAASMSLMSIPESQKVLEAVGVIE